MKGRVRGTGQLPKKIGEAGVIAAMDTSEASLVRYMLDQAAAHVAAMSGINGTPRGSSEATELVIANARIARPLVVEPVLDLGVQAGFMAKAARELLGDYTMDVARHMFEHTLRSDPVAAVKLLCLLCEVGAVDTEASRDTIVRAVRILGGNDARGIEDPRDRLSKLADDLEAMRQEFVGKQEIPGA
jgi:hypothetical protein